MRSSKGKCKSPSCSKECDSQHLSENNGCTGTQGVIYGTWIFNVIMLLIIGATFFKDAILSPSIPIISPAFTLYTPGMGEPGSPYYQILDNMTVFLSMDQLDTFVNYSEIPSSLFPPEAKAVCQETPIGHAGSISVLSLKPNINNETGTLVTTSSAASSSLGLFFSIRWVYLTAMITCGLAQLISLACTYFSTSYLLLEDWMRSINYFCLAFLNIFGVLVIICLWGAPVIQTLILWGFVTGGSVTTFDCLSELHESYREISKNLRQTTKADMSAALTLHNSPLSICTRRLFFIALVIYVVSTMAMFTMLLLRSYNWLLTDSLADWRPLYISGLNSFSLAVNWIYVGGYILSSWLLFGSMALDFGLKRHNKLPRTFMAMTVEELQIFLSTCSNLAQNMTLLMIGITAYFATNNSIEMTCS